MDGAVFGSYSLTEFKDLYDLNIRNNHHYSFFVEVDSYGVVKFHQHKIDNIVKRPNTYMIGILSPTIDTFKLEKHGVEFFESAYDFDIDYLINTKKDFFYMIYEESKLTVMSTKHKRIYFSENCSFSSTEIHGYTGIKPNRGYTFPVFNDNHQFITVKRNYDY